MNKREAKILALEVFAENANLLIESERVSDAIKSSKDCDLIASLLKNWLIVCRKERIR